MPHVEDRVEKKVFHPQDFVLWHYQPDGHAHPLPIPAVVVEQRDEGVLIRTRVNGDIKQITVSPDELEAR
jgi:hypothetical protein